MFYSGFIKKQNMDKSLRPFSKNTQEAQGVGTFKEI